MCVCVSVFFLPIYIHMHPLDDTKLFIISFILTEAFQIKLLQNERRLTDYN